MFHRSHIAAVAAALFASFVGAVPAAAHITLEASKAVSGSFYKAVFRVPHGCDGAATVRLRVQIPENVTDVKPQPKPGWELTTIKGKLARPIVGDHGNQITEGVREVSWSGGRLLDEHYDEFVVRVKLPDAPGTVIYFPTVQECEKGVTRWIEIPAAGKSDDDYKEPAPHVTLAPRR